MNHESIDEGDVVSYGGEEYEVEKVWNHGYQQWWFDLKSLKPMIENTDMFRQEKSVPSYDCKLIRKKDTTN